LKQHCCKRALSWRIIASIRQCDRAGRYSDALFSNRLTYPCPGTAVVPPEPRFPSLEAFDDAAGARDFVRAGRHPIFTKPAPFFHICTSDTGRHAPARTMLRTPEEKSPRCHDRTEHGCGHTVATASFTRGKTMVFITPGNRTPVCRSTVKPSRSCGRHWHGRGLVCRPARKPRARSVLASDF
jgi:hypothetical protein